ncbi:MAG: hypothetical protein KC589_09815 [Nanoarchaeota archaeon]|nr:hypothetical protein [Nanoarchaeota archaeon]
MNLLKKLFLKLNSLAVYIGIPKHEVSYIDRYWKRKTQHEYYLEIGR